MTKIIIFSDIHGNNFTFSEFCKMKDALFPDHKTFFLGDIYGYYYDGNYILGQCIERNIVCLLGNHDFNLIELLNENLNLNDLTLMYGNSYRLALKTMNSRAIEFLKILNSVVKFKVNHKTILMCHGSPLDPLNGRIYPDTDLVEFEKVALQYDVVISGHTHHKMARRYRDCLFLNPGSLGQPRDGAGCSFLELDIGQDWYRFHKVDFNPCELIEMIDIYDPDRQDLQRTLTRDLAHNFGEYGRKYRMTKGYSYEA